MADNRRNRHYRPRNGKKPGSGPAKESRPPHPQYENCAVLEKALSESLSEESLVRAVGVCWNKYAWYAEREAALDAESPELAECCENSDAWSDEYFKLMEKLKSFIGLGTDATFALPELTVLMNRYGFEDVDGTWRKAREKKEPKEQKEQPEQ